MAKVFGIQSSVLGDSAITGQVVETADLDTSGEKKELVGNPPTEIADVRMGKVTQTLHVVCKFESIPSADQQRDLVKSTSTSTVTITSMDGAAISLTGKITDFKVGAKKDDWWDGEFTIEYVASSGGGTGGT